MKVIIKTSEQQGWRIRQMMRDAGLQADGFSILPKANAVEISVDGCIKQLRAWLKQQPFNATVKP